MQDYAWILYIIAGIKITLSYSIIAVLFGILIGAIIAIMYMSPYPVLNLIAKFYISIIRGTPLLLQLSIFYYALPQLIGLKLSAFTAGIMAFSINSSAYVAEIIRSGVMAIDRGQFEAAQSFSISYYDTMKDIILPQAIKNTIPALLNEVINLVKESSLVAVIGEADIMRRATIQSMENFSYFGPLLVAGVCYYVLVLILSYFSQKLERKLHAVKY